MENNKPEKPSKFLTQVLPVIIALLALGGFVGVVWYAYQKGQERQYEDVVPTVRAEQESFRTKPDDPGGMDVPHQDKYVFHQDGMDGETEALMGGRSPTEPTEDEELPEVEVTKNSVEVIEVDESESLEENVGEALQQTERKVEQTLAEADPDIDVDPVEDAQADDTAEVDIGLDPMVPQEEKADINTPATPIYRVQLLSVKSNEAAAKARERLAATPALSGLPLYVTEADLGQKGIYYRVQAGDFSEKNDAIAFCNDYKKTGQGCFVTVVRP